MTSLETEIYRDIIANLQTRMTAVERRLNSLREASFSVISLLGAEFLVREWNAPAKFDASWTTGVQWALAFVAINLLLRFLSK